MADEIPAGLVSVKMPAGKPFAVALATLIVITLIGLVLAILIPRQQASPHTPGLPAAPKTPTVSFASTADDG